MSTTSPPPPSPSPAPLVCSECGAEVATKNKLFQHLQDVHSFERDSAFIKPPKVSLVMGWLSNDAEEENGWMDGGFLRRGYSDEVEQELWKAIDTVENIKTDFGECPRGFSRGNGSAQRASHLLQSEATCHAVGDLFCFCLKKLGPPKTMEWVDRINAELPSHIRALQVYNMPTKYADFHAEQNCSQRVFEYIVPLAALFDTTLDDTTEVELPAPSPEKQKLRAWKRIDGRHPRYTAQGIKRIEFFRVLKKILKQYSGFGKKASYHNFVNGGGCPEDAVVGRKINRVYHKDIIVPSRQGDSMEEDSYKRSDMEWEDGLEPKESKEEWAVFSFSADSLMRGQARKMLGLAIAIAKGLLPQNFIEVALNPEVILNIPALPASGLYASETKFDKWEIKFGFQVDPRREKDADTSRIDQWTKVVRGNAINLTKEKYGLAGDGWLPDFEAQCAKCFQQYETERSLWNRGPEALQQFLQAQQETGDTRFSSLPQAHQDAYKKVLNLLQDAEASGNWPGSSLARQKVVTDDTLAEQGGAGGTFTVGVLPGGQKQPKANTLFPELLKACFELEQVVAPHRPPSSTIAVNKHAQFRPHRDTGAGNGQSKSLIVSLGDFAGGELMIECEPRDLRYNATEFDGWNERHWTVPFEGERFSLVWFTPLGVNIPEDLFWIDQATGKVKA